MIPVQLILVGVLTIASASSAWLFQENRYAAKLATLSAEHSLAQAAASARALEETTRLQRAVDAAAALAEKRQRDMARDLARTRSALDGLRNDLSTARSAMPGASCDSLRQHASTLNTVFGECSAEVERLGAAATGHAIDTLKLQESWPK